jgi:hypothetical protein
LTTIQTDFRKPPLRDTSLDKVIQAWLQAIGQRLPLITADTSGGNISDALPPAGLSSTATGETNQNMQISFVKTSTDGNTFTITGAASGNVILSAQFDHATFKSDGTNWYRIA